MSVAVFGERPVVDIVLEVGAIPRPGDKALVRGERIVPGGVAENTAYALGRLGVPTTYIGCGSDGSLEQTALASLREAGVEVVTLEGLSGPGVVCYVTVARDGSRTVLVRLPDDRDRIVAGYVTAVAALAPRRFALGYAGVLSGPVLNAWPVLGSLCDRIAVGYEADEVDVTLATVDLAPGTIVFCAEESYGAELGALVDTHGVDLIVTCGSRGGYLLRRGEPRLDYAAVGGDGPVVDTTGAGDAFAAGVLAGLARGAAWPECLALGARTARRTVEAHGPRASLD